MTTQVTTQEQAEPRKRRRKTYFGLLLTNVLEARGKTQRDFVDRLNEIGWPPFHQQEVSNWLYADTLPSYILVAINEAMPDLTDKERRSLEWARNYGLVPFPPVLDRETMVDIVERRQRGERLDAAEWKAFKPIREQFQAIRQRTKKDFMQ